MRLFAILALLLIPLAANGSEWNESHPPLNAAALPAIPKLNVAAFPKICDCSNGGTCVCGPNCDCTQTVMAGGEEESGHRERRQARRGARRGEPEQTPQQQYIQAPNGTYYEVPAEAARIVHYPYNDPSQVTYLNQPIGTYRFVGSSYPQFSSCAGGSCSTGRGRRR